MRGNFNKRNNSNNQNRGYTGGNGGSYGNDSRFSLQSRGGENFYETNEVKTAYNDRLNYLLINSIGSDVTVTVNSGIQYQGLLAAAKQNSSKGIDVLLKFPKVIGTDITEATIDGMSERLQDTLMIDADDVAELSIPEVDFSADEKWEKNHKDSISKKKSEDVEKMEGTKSFMTDVDIARGAKDLKERELTKWKPDDAENFTLTSEALEDNNTQWDQFAVNEKKFGVKSSYDEHFYTTKINKNDPNYEKRLKEAERIAREIESQGASTNVHVNEDRGIRIDDSGMDEEDMYSGVDRNATDTRGDELLAALKSNAKPSLTKPNNKYLPPTLKSQPHHMDPAIISSTIEKGVDNEQLKEQPKPVPSNVESDEVEQTVRIVKSEHRESTDKPLKQENKLLERGNIAHKDAIAHRGGDKHATFEKESHHSSSRFNTKNGHSHQSPNNRTVKPKLSKAAQIEELKRFSEKFKVPYEVPKDMKDTINKKPSTSPHLKSDASLSSKVNMRTSKPSTPTAVHGKDTKRQGNNFLNNSLPAGSSSPSHSKPHSSSRKSQQYSCLFFSPRKQKHGNALDEEHLLAKKSFATKFNMFLSSKEAYDAKVNAASTGKDAMEPFFIEKPYFTTPTWVSTIDRSYKTLFPDEASIMRKAQAKFQRRQMSYIGNGVSGVNTQMMGMNGAMAMSGINPNMVGMMGFPMAPGASPSTMMNGFNNVGMYMPYQPQPMFYPTMPQMMPMMNGMVSSDDNGASLGPSGAVSPNGVSPQISSGFMEHAHMGAMTAPGAGFNPYSGAIPMPGMMGAGSTGHSHTNHRQSGYHNNHYHNHHNSNNHHNNNFNGSRGGHYTPRNQT